MKLVFLGVRIIVKSLFLNKNVINIRNIIVIVIWNKIWCSFFRWF